MTFTLRRAASLVLALLMALTVAAAVRPAPAAAATCPSSAVFVRPGGANGLGHVGFSYFDCDGGYWYAGSVENPSGSVYIPPGGDNGFWQSSFTSFEGVKAAMRSRGYNNYRYMVNTTFSPNAYAAYQKAEEYRNGGYAVAFNNCANATYDVIVAYGGRGVPLLQASPAPNTWYNNFFTTKFASEPNAWSQSFAL
jgi:hypothetical protein